MLVCNSPRSSSAAQEFSSSSPKRRRAEEKDEGIGSPDTLEEEKVEELRREMLELRQQLDKERAARMQMEEQVRSRDIAARRCEERSLAAGSAVKPLLSEAAAAAIATGGVDTFSRRLVPKPHPGYS